MGKKKKEEGKSGKGGKKEKKQKKEKKGVEFRKQRGTLYLLLKGSEYSAISSDLETAMKKAIEVKKKSPRSFVGVAKFIGYAVEEE